ncbi:hypothetical protein, partial [Victivallis vadensis]|uniref:hypothetical protein n=1 Tax=Victivallis vadensis TaxID=172901 RepID=UPI0026716D00
MKSRFHNAPAVSHNSRYVKRQGGFSALQFINILEVRHFVLRCKSAYVHFYARYRQQLKGNVCLSGPMPSDVNLGVRSPKGLLPL